MGGVRSLFHPFRRDPSAFAETVRQAAALEYAPDRKRKALATLRRAEAAEKEGCFTVDSKRRARSATILGHEASDFERGDGGHEGVPFILGDGK